MGVLALLLSLGVVRSFRVVKQKKVNKGEMRDDDAGFVPANDTTANGCKCVDQCGPTLAKHHKCDWCHVDKKTCNSRWLPTRGNYDFCDLKDDGFASLSHSQKLQQLWAKVSANTRPGPLLSKAGVFKEILTVSMVSTFDNTRETMAAGRRKMIHASGVVLQFDFVVQGDSPYSGMMAPGTHRGLMRLGPAMPVGMSVAPGPANATFPGIAIKFLRSGIHSANTVALRQNGDLSGQIHFFEEPLSTHVEPPPPLVAIGKFTQASACVPMTGMSDFCSYSQDGQQVSTLHFPYELQFEAPDPMLVAVNPSAEDHHRELLNSLSSIRSGTHLYWVNARATPSSSWVRVGKMVSRSRSTESMFGDTQLHFRHQRMEEDFHKHPEWVSQVKEGNCAKVVDKKGRLRPLSDWQCPGVVGVPPI